MQNLYPTAGFLLLAACFPPAAYGADARPVSTDPFETAGALTPRNKIDELVFARWKELGIQPANLCSDSVFLRRAWLDVTGTLPTAQQATEFLNSQDPDKRAVLIDQLLAGDEFADYWAMKWSDLLRVKAEFPIELWPNAAQAYYHWIRDSLRENKPYDQFVREMLTASGSNFREAPVNFYRAMQNHEPAGIAQTRGLDLHGRADRKVAGGAAGANGGVFLSSRVQTHGRMERGNCFFRFCQSSCGHADLSGRNAGPAPA